MKTNAVRIIILGAIVISPILFTACSGNHPAAAGVAGAAAYNKYDENQKKEDLKNAANNREKRER